MAVVIGSGFYPPVDMVKAGGPAWLELGGRVDETDSSEEPWAELDISSSDGIVPLAVALDDLPEREAAFFDALIEVGNAEVFAVSDVLRHSLEAVLVEQVQDLDDPTDHDTYRLFGFACANTHVDFQLFRRWWRELPEDLRGALLLDIMPWDEVAAASERHHEIVLLHDDLWHSFMMTPFVAANLPAYQLLVDVCRVIGDNEGSEQARARLLQAQIGMELDSDSAEEVEASEGEAPGDLNIPFPEGLRV